MTSSKTGSQTGSKTGSQTGSKTGSQTGLKTGLKTPKAGLKTGLKNPKLRYTGFKGLPVASFILRLRWPRIGYARLVKASNMPNHSTTLDLQDRYNPRSTPGCATNVVLK